MPVYTIIVKDKSTLSTKETKIKANTDQEAKRIAEGRGQTVITIKNITN